MPKKNKKKLKLRDAFGKPVRLMDGFEYFAPTAGILVIYRAIKKRRKHK